MVHRPPALKSEPRPATPSKIVVGGIALVLLEIAWFVWFLRDPLPNAGIKGLRRWDVLAQSIPGVFDPRLKFRDSGVGHVFHELSQFENFPERLPLLLAAGFIAVSAIATGQLVLRLLRRKNEFDSAEQVAVGYGLGTTFLGLATLICGRMGWISPEPVRVALALPIVLELVLVGLGLFSKTSTKVDREETIREPEPMAWRSKLGLALVVGPFLVLMTLGAMLPSVDFDAIEYHLQGPKEYFQAGQIRFLPHNVYTSMPFSIEMLHLLGMEVLNDWWRGALVGQLLIAGFAPAAAILIARTAARLGSPRAGWVSAAVYLTTPWIYRLSVLSYVEGPLCYFHAGLIFLVARNWSGERFTNRPTDSQGGPWERVGQFFRVGILIGMFAGGAMATKYPGLVSAVIPFALWAIWLSWKQKSGRVAIGFVLGVSLVMTPWLAKNVIDTGNPVYPLGYKVFGGSDWSAARDAKWANAHGPKPVEIGAFVKSLVEIAGRSDWQSPLFLALGPLALLRSGSTRRGAAWLAAYAAYLFLTWWLFTHRLDRFWLPMLPALAILAGLGADWTRSKGWTVFLSLCLGLAIWINLIYCCTKLAGLNEWMGRLTTLRASVPERLNPALVRLDAELPPGSKALLVGQAAVFHLTRPIIYNTVFNEETIELLAKGRTADELAQEFHRLGITHVYVEWSEIARYRSPGNYGFTPFVTEAFFENLVKSKVLDPPSKLGARQVLYKVRTH